MTPRPDPVPPLLGSWARSEGFVGLVAAVRATATVHGGPGSADDAEVTLFDPGARQATTVASADCEPLPAGAVTVTVTVDLPLAHGLAEPDLRRWIASLLDPGVRERAAGALEAAGLDGGAALPEARLDVTPAQGGGALCLAGHRTPAEGRGAQVSAVGVGAAGPPPPGGEPVACATCGRAAVGPPQPALRDVLGLG